VPSSAVQSCPQTNPINNSSDIYLPISKSTHHPTNKKPHECGANLFY